jgi:hypothetical protein
MFKIKSSEYVIKVGSGEWHNVHTSTEYLAWVAAGNAPAPADPPTPEEIAAAAQAAQDLADRQETQADAKFRALTSKSPAQVKAWVRNRFPSLTLPEQDDLATVVQVVGVLARRL